MRAYTNILKNPFALLALALLPLVALAGGGGSGGLIDPSTFTDINQTLQALLENSYGAMVSLIAFAVGVWFAVQQRYIAMLGAFIVAIACLVVPGVIMSMFGAGMAPIA